MPNQPKTPHTSFRIPADLKTEAVAKAAAEDRTLTDVIVALLSEYVMPPTPETPKGPR
jgi:hypothetical protein